ncbi:hypothetical protein [Sphingomonas sp. GC_Shp_3]|uniref:hypothetical protein n=1 Tax=Sphingomonas sp. GC_Shp_3 TaxID=2937383 RepID=UPI00226A2D40|nr:hypothetical protein [Sphingomonas sp. GC_Shp_3]
MFEIIGRHHLGATGGWTGEEILYEDLGPAFARPKDVFEGTSDRIKDASLYNRHVAQVLDLLGHPGALHLTITNAQWVTATDRWRRWETARSPIVQRRDAIFYIMHRLGMSPSKDKGLGYCFTLSTGDVRELDTRHWNCSFDVACDRFERAALCGKAEYKMHRPDPWRGGRDYFEHFVMPIFVDQANLAAVISHIPVFDGDHALAVAQEPSLHVVEKFLARNAASSPPPSAVAASKAQQPSAAAPKPRWNEGTMTRAILRWADQTQSRDRDRAWREHFKGMTAEHGWDNRNFRDHWSIALGSAGQPGRPKSAR